MVACTAVVGGMYNGMLRRRLPTVDVQIGRSMHMSLYPHLYTCLRLRPSMSTPMRAQFPVVAVPAADDNIVGFGGLDGDEVARHGILAQGGRWFDHPFSSNFLEAFHSNFKAVQ